MEIIQINQPNFVVIVPKGEVDANSSIHLDDKIGELIAANSVKILLDCSEMTYISSAGLGVFVSYLEELEEKKGKLIFSNMRANIFDVFELLGLDQLLTIVSDNLEAEKILTETEK
ncbi:MAG: STAS domain-containing protein [Bacteroidia bacterium]